MVKFAAMSAERIGGQEQNEHAKPIIRLFGEEMPDALHRREYFSSPLPADQEESPEQPLQELRHLSSESGAEAKGKKKNVWESFSAEPEKGQRFMNLYTGPFYQRMELARANAERLIKVAALDGTITLSDFTPERRRSIEGVNPDGSAIARRNLFWGERLPTDVEETKERSLVTSTPDGWRIEIDGQSIAEKLSREESRLSREQRFVKFFNDEVRSALNGIIVKEKLVLNDFNSYLRLGLTVFSPLLVYVCFETAFETAFSLGLRRQPYVKEISMILSSYSIINLEFFKISKDEGFPESLSRRHLDSWYDWFMPPLEVDRVIRGLAFVNLKGRDLVRLAKDQGSK